MLCARCAISASPLMLPLSLPRNRKHFKVITQAQTQGPDSPAAEAQQWPALCFQ